MTPEMKEYVDGLEKRADAGDTRITKLETAEKVRKVHTDLEAASNVPFEKAELTDLLIKLGPEDRATICKVLTGASALIKAGGTGELGSTLDDEGTENSALTKLYAKAEELRKGDDTLTEAKAFVKATELMPDEYKEYRFGKQANMAQVQ